MPISLYIRFPEIEIKMLAWLTKKRDKGILGSRFSLRFEANVYLEILI